MAHIPYGYRIERGKAQPDPEKAEKLRVGTSDPLAFYAVCFGKHTDFQHGNHSFFNGGQNHFFHGVLSVRKGGMHMQI